MHFRKFRWSQVYESSEEELIDFLAARGIEGKRIHAKADDEQIEQRTDNVTSVWCAEGSLMLKTNTASTSLQPGDAIRLETDTKFVIQPGFADCVYYLSS